MVKIKHIFILIFLFFLIRYLYLIFIDNDSNIGLSLDYTSKTGGIYNNKCLFEREKNYQEGRIFSGKDYHSVMSFGGKRFAKPIPAWAKCIWKYKVNSAWGYEYSEKYGIPGQDDLDLLALVPPSLFKEILANAGNSEIHKSLQLNLSFDDAVLNPSWEIFVWSKENIRKIRKQD